jgi:hypothetical protein
MIVQDLFGNRFHDCGRELMPAPEKKSDLVVKICNQTCLLKVVKSCGTCG